MLVAYFLQVYGILYFLWQLYITHTEIFNLSLALTAIGFAIPPLFHLNKIAREISTHSTGSFPRHLTIIADIVSNANESVDILADCVDYGSFFDPRAHERVFQSIIEAVMKRKIAIRVLVCGNPQPITRNSPFFDIEPGELTTNKQFADYYEKYIDALHGETDFMRWIDTIYKDEDILEPVKKFFDNWLPLQDKIDDSKVAMTNSEFLHLIGRCISACNKVIKLSEINERDLDALLMLRQKWFEMRLTTIGVSVAYLRDEAAAIFFWLKDKELDAVFAFADSGRAARGRGFRTHDSDLLRIFNSIFEEKWHKTVSKALPPG